VRVLHYDGTPITARFIARAIRDSVSKITPAMAPKQKETA
jgi:hypothetical protein